MRPNPSTLQGSIDWYREIVATTTHDPELLREARRELARTDLFYLLVGVLGRKDASREWIFDRCREVEREPDGYLDLWAREHYKSTIITFARTIQDILRDPEVTVGIFSYSRPIAKAFLRQIKREFEANEDLRQLFPDIIWDNPEKDAPKWSEDDGIIVRRKGNPKESTIEAWGLVDAQPTSKHFRLMVYDDVVTKDSVTTPEMIAKVTAAWEASRNLTAEGGATRYIGTRWHHADTYREIIRRGAAVERRHAATANGQMDGPPVLMSRETLRQKRRDMGPYTFGAQMLLDPVADRTQGFRDEWLRYHEDRGDFSGMTKYLLVDAASSKKRDSDFTAMVVIGLGSDQNYYVLDMVRDRLSLRERGDAVFALHRRWRPARVGYERYGMMADIEYIRERMAEEHYHFDVVELGGRVAKNDRIRRLVPLFEAGRVWLPETMHKRDHEGRVVDLVQNFIDEEYRAFPVALHDDMLDAMARIEDAELLKTWPKPEAPPLDRYARAARRQGRLRLISWQAA